MASSSSSSSNRDGTNDVLLSLILFACSAKLWLESLDVHRGLRRRHLGRDHYHNSNSVHASAVRSSDSFLASLRQHSQNLLPSCTSAAIQSNRNTIQTASNSQHKTKINQQQQPQEEEDSDEEDYIRKKRISLQDISYYSIFFQSEKNILLSEESCVSEIIIIKFLCPLSQPIIHNYKLCLPWLLDIYFNTIIIIHCISLS